MKKLSKLKIRVVVLLGAFMAIFYGLNYAEDNYERFPAQFNVTDLNGNNGFVINGISSGDSCGRIVAMAGDVNGDGIDDILLSAPLALKMAGQTYVVFGSHQPWPPEFYLSNLNGNNGFTINGVNFNDASGFALSGAGDVNGDGLADILIGATRKNNGHGQSYVLFGSKQPWPAVINLQDLNGKNGFAINGPAGSLNNGHTLSMAGDINGDGLEDIIIGAPGNVGKDQGRGYLIFGNKGPWAAIFNLENLDGNNGFLIYDISKHADTGWCVSKAGDVNSDGIADMLISDSEFQNEVGQIYVIFGHKGQWPSNISIDTLNGNNGFIINGIHQLDATGDSLNNPGDVNGDHIDDILIGAPGFNSYSGASFIIFGHKGPWSDTFNLTNVNGTNGFIINGIHSNDFSAVALSRAGDINDDGILDILIGANDAYQSAGQSYIVFGSKSPWPTNFNLANLNGNNGFAINGVALDISGWSVSGTGDINGDGIADFIIGAIGPLGLAATPGRVYVIFGQHQ